MIEIKDKKLCCGCTACSSICPQKCIEMKADEEGFLYPEVDEKSCVSCNLCNKVCPVNNLKIDKEFARKTYATKAVDSDNRINATSGGLFLPVLQWVFDQGGIVCAAGYDKDFNVCHMLLDSKEIASEDPFVVNRFRGSKYVQSDMKDCFVRIKELLNQGRLLCFIGTTCQVSGLKNFLLKEYENLYTIDLVCHGTPSPKLWRSYLDYQQKKHRSSIEQIAFRSKVYGYHSGGMMTIKFSNGRKYCASARVDYMLKCFFKEIASRPVCYDCPFKGVEKCSDLTVYDCWHYSQLTGQEDDNKGYTNVIVQSPAGETLLNNLKDKLSLIEVDTMQAVKLDGLMILESAKPNKMRGDFYKDFDNRSLDETISKFIPVSKKDHLVEAVKQIMYKTGLLKKRRKRRK